MNQEKIGKFIAICRKKQNLTQEELAEKLGISKNAVSKWERGLNLPDASIMEELCDILKISLNELFAGQLINNNDLQENSEKNLLNIVKEENHTRKKLRIFIIISLTIIIVLIISLIALYKIMSNYMSVAKTFELNWGIILPNNFEEEYYVDTGASFHGDGERYSVFKGNNFMTSLKKEKNQELENELSELYTSLKVSKENQINFQHQYSWTKIISKDDDRNYIYCIFDEEVNKFYFYEFLM